MEEQAAVPVVQQDVWDPHLAGGEPDGLHSRVVLWVPHQVDVRPVLQGRVTKLAVGYIFSMHFLLLIHYRLF